MSLKKFVFVRKYSEKIYMCEASYFVKALPHQVCVGKHQSRHLTIRMLVHLRYYETCSLIKSHRKMILLLNCEKIVSILEEINFLFDVKYGVKKNRN